MNYSRLLILYSFLVSCCGAEPVLLATLGETTLVETYLSDLDQSTINDGKDYDVELFPMKTNMKLKNFSKSTSPITVDEPFFVLGCDEYSIRWLIKNRSEFERIGAIGYIVQAENEIDLNRVKKYSGKLSLVLADGDGFINMFNVNNYPFYVVRDEIRQ